MIKNPRLTCNNNIDYYYRRWMIILDIMNGYIYLYIYIYIKYIDLN